MVTAKHKDTLEEFDKILVYKLIFPSMDFVEGKLDKLNSELKKLLQTFLTIQRYSAHDHEVQRMIDLTAELRLRGLEERYLQTLEKTKKQIEAQKEVSLGKFQGLLAISLEEHEWESTYNKAKGDLNIPAVIKHLDQYYYTERTGMLNLLLLQQKAAILQSFSVKLLSEHWIVPEKIMQENILLYLSWKVNELMSLPNPKIEQFQELLQLLQANEKKIARRHLLELFGHLRNLCTVLIVNGYEELKGVLHHIHKDNLVRGYFYFDGKIPSNSFLSITMGALNVNSLQWANDFVEQHKAIIIGESETHDFYRMNKAICLFAENKFDEALDIIPHASSYSFYHLLARRLELKIYYELDSELLPYKIDAFKMFISRAGKNVLSENMHELSVNFINFLRQLSLSPKIKDKARSTQMIKRINEKKLVADRAWLLEKATELGGLKKTTP